LLLDICLPFRYTDGLKIISHQARFIMLNGKILGIRIKTGNLWNRYQT